MNGNKVTRFSQNDRGAIGGVEGMAFGVLVFVFGMLMVVNAWAVINGKLAATAAAREASRTLAEGLAEHSKNHTDTTQIARDVVLGYVPTAQNIHVILHSDTSQGFGRCAIQSVEVEYTVPRIAIPLLDGAGGTRRVRGHHSEIIDPYRSGTAGEVHCSA